ncbi:MAG: sulfite exporter TauE/SafE family protein [Bacteroidales bacterium]|nr:sulfite exporter TauE/SafE family protein [Bacteroidales bacterium]
MDITFFLLLFLIAFLYSSVGHGGASGYLALLALYGVAPESMRQTALTLNVFVSGIAFFNYYKARHFRLGLVLPFLITSVPLAFLGAMVSIKPIVYKNILGGVLLIAVLRMLLETNAEAKTTKKPPLGISLLVGAALGFLSGLIGIGGGIILSPILILMHWATLKETAAASAFLILLNSLSGLLALNIGGLCFDSPAVLWVITGFAGGIAGSYFGSFRLRPALLKYPLAAVLILASIKLFVF